MVQWAKFLARVDMKLVGLKKWLKKWNRPKIRVGVGVFFVLALAGWLLFPRTSPEPKKTETAAISAKKVAVISFGAHAEESFRAVPGVVRSSLSPKIIAKKDGTIAQVLVRIGAWVKKGQVLAEYERHNDLSQINYENARNTLLAQRLSAENSVKKSTTDLSNAESDLRITISTQARLWQETLSNLSTKLQISHSVLEKSRDFVAMTLGVSEKFRREILAVHALIGRHDSIGRQALLTKTEGLMRAYRLALGSQNAFSGPGFGEVEGADF